MTFFYFVIYQHKSQVTSPGFSRLCSVHSTKTTRDWFVPLGQRGHVNNKYYITFFMIHMNDESNRVLIKLLTWPTWQIKWRFVKTQVFTKSRWKEKYIQNTDKNFYLRILSTYNHSIKLQILYSSYLQDTASKLCNFN